MRIAVAGATGNIGARTVSALEKNGHEAIRISRSLGVDLTTGEGLDPALEGVDAVVDAISAELTVPCVLSSLSGAGPPLRDWTADYYLTLRRIVGGWRSAKSLSCGAIRSSLWAVNRSSMPKSVFAEC
jgi:hypothetical protein